MDAKILFKKALEQATAIIKCVEKRHFKNDTPCTEWNCQTLINHMLYELSWVPDLLKGKTVAQVGSKYDGDLLGKDHIKNWQEAANDAVKAVNDVALDKMIHLSYGDVPASYYINEVGTDLLIHSWDAAQSFKCSLIMQPDATKAIYDIVHSKKHEYANSGLFGSIVDVPKEARLQTKLLALLGRREPEYEAN